MNKPTVIIIGGGAAGFFSACQLIDLKFTGKIIILEKDKEVLKKVKISGGGRCNVTHNCFDQRELLKFYPRGEKELYGPFLQFQPKDTIAWFLKNGITLKTESDGRIFPDTDSSETIINCFLNICNKNKIELILNFKVTDILKTEDKWEIRSPDKILFADFLLITSGSNIMMWNLVKKLGHTIFTPVPSLFTFKIKDKDLNDLAGISLPKVNVKINGLKYLSEGPTLITHWGLSGPAILKLSAFAAIDLKELNYEFEIFINWISQSRDNIMVELKRIKVTESKKKIGNVPIHKIPNRFWIYILQNSNISLDQQWANINKQQMSDLVTQLTQMSFFVQGKSTNKDEFVTAGGISLKEINFKNFQSKIHDNLFFAGEILNIDGLTGGFNFQAAWTGAYLASKGILTKIKAEY